MNKSAPSEMILTCKKISALFSLWFMITIKILFRPAFGFYNIILGIELPPSPILFRDQVDYEKIFKKQELWFHFEDFLHIKTWKFLSWFFIYLRYIMVRKAVILLIIHLPLFLMFYLTQFVVCTSSALFYFWKKGFYARDFSFLFRLLQL